MTTREPTPDILGNIMIGAPVAVPAPTSTTRRVHELRPHPLNETIYGDRADADLIESVRTKGVLNPVLITVDNLIVSGHRRWGAAIAAGLTEVPVVVFGSSEALDVEEALIESNRQRQKTNEQIGREFKQLKAIINQRQSRQGQRTDRTSVSNETEVALPSEQAAAELGVSRTTAHRIETVVNQIDTLQAAGQSEEAAELRQTLNRSVNAAHQQVRPAQPAMLAVWELQATVREVFTQVYGGNPEPYATRDMRTGAQMRAGRFWLLCTQSLPANQFRLSDLAQAINNVAAQVEAQAPVVTTTIAPTVAYVVAADDPAEPERSTAPTAHQSEPIQYAEIWKLQSIVRGLSMSPTRGFGAFDAKTMAELLRRAAANRSADDFWNACIGSIQKQRLAHRTNDLVQAINNYASQIETKYDVRSDDRPLPAWAADATSDEETQEPEDRQQQLVELLIDATRDEYAEWILAAAEGKHPRIFIMCENLASQEQYFGCDLKAALRQVSQRRYDAHQEAPANPRPVPLMSQRAATPEPVMATVAQTVADVVEVHGEPAPVAVETVEVTTPVSQRADYESDEWYTPQEYIDAAKAVMGAIDLDPASSEMAQTVVRAGVYLTRFDDGLAQTRWIHQRVWLNPPYSNPAPWIEKLVREHQAGPFCTEAIVLVNNATETSWFQLLLERFPVCLPARRLAFWRHDHANVGARQGQAFFYLGPNVAKFQEVFSQFGPILRRLS